MFSSTCFLYVVDFYTPASCDIVIPILYRSFDVSTRLNLIIRLNVKQVSLAQLDCANDTCLIIGLFQKPPSVISSLLFECCNPSRSFLTTSKPQERYHLPAGARKAAKSWQADCGYLPRVEVRPPPILFRLTVAA